MSEQTTNVKSRANLTVYYQNEKGLRRRCGLCGKNVEEEGHHRNCVFADPSITHAQIVGMKAQVVIHTDKDGVRYWMSPSGERYNIRKARGGYVVKKQAKDSIGVSLATMAYVRAFIEQSQGVL